MNELMQSINSLTNEISEKMTTQVFDAVELLLEKRQQLFAELMAVELSPAEMITVRDFIAVTQERDQQAMQSLQSERTLVQDAIVKTGKLKGYL